MTRGVLVANRRKSEFRQLFQHLRRAARRGKRRLPNINGSVGWCTQVVDGVHRMRKDYRTVVWVLHNHDVLIVDNRTIGWVYQKSCKNAKLLGCGEKPVARCEEVDQLDVTPTAEPSNELILFVTPEMGRVEEDIL